MSAISGYFVNSNNCLVVNAVFSVIKNPGGIYNPIIICGSYGTGKTHLLHAVENYIQATSTKSIIYTTSEDFLSEFIQSIELKKVMDFKKKFCFTDVLLFDDIHFLQNKPATQEELLLTSNSLISNKKQVVFTCDRPLDELEKFSRKLSLLLNQGLQIDI